ncbi:murein L,D-transpeptidase catalytic domain family protein [Pelodictyon luteolum]|uniref:Murein L,D-transpeptidase catalytic domain family protein n=1 Tax=Chlorobium luteolum (strain DSM 273 / BCRC 81028 / 2530) TaxID=319225 RepID=Q3B631_CHLL3|nr:murein L,D-transpeptidase catalytic domain family protein [Pelodictyon luteolum]ABB23200.1 hypothetical protein Plut_0312 [Pelodictyon luteolum DSM 273]
MATMRTVAFSALLYIIVLFLPAPVLAAGTPPSRAAHIAAFAAAPALRSEISPKLLTVALSGYYRMLEQGEILREGVMTVIDFNRPSSEKRLFVIDIRNMSIIYSSLVAHGSGSGGAKAARFSNEPGSFQSSLGFFTTGDTYAGRHGYSLRLEGLEEGVNDNAAMRSIVIHGADYATRGFISKYGRLGRSQGCPALPPGSSRPVIDLIKGGSCLFIYHDSAGYAASVPLPDPDRPS